MAVAATADILQADRLTSLVALAASIEASCDAVIEGILTLLGEWVSRSGAPLSHGVQMVNQTGARRIDIYTFHAVRALPRLLPRLSRQRLLRLLPIPRRALPADPPALS